MGIQLVGQSTPMPQFARPCPSGMKVRCTWRSRRCTRKGGRCIRSAVYAREEGQGKAWLIGCGPGDVDLLTLKAVKLIKAAEVILYDDLGTEAAVQEFASGSAVKEYVGKRGGKKSMQQADIDALLVRYCLQGKRVVRLKGGCPSVFSRCSSEIGALTHAGIPLELVPGVSSALAAPLLAGFPLTDTNVGRSFAVTSAHDPGSIHWAGFRGVDTLVLLMSGRSLPQVVDGLLGSGWAADTPVAIVRSAGLPEQATWLADLGTILEATRDAGSLSPCVTVVGRVVSQAAGFRQSSSVSSQD